MNKQLTQGCHFIGFLLDSQALDNIHGPLKLFVLGLVAYEDIDFFPLVLSSLVMPLSSGWVGQDLCRLTPRDIIAWSITEHN